MRRGRMGKEALPLHRGVRAHTPPSLDVRQLVWWHVHIQPWSKARDPVCWRWTKGTCLLHYLSPTRVPGVRGVRVLLLRLSPEKLHLENRPANCLVLSGDHPALLLSSS